MVRMLTDEERNYLIEIKGNGEYRDHHNNPNGRIHHETLYLVFWYYMKNKGKLESVFKTRHFFKKQDAFARLPIYSDNILSRGELMTAIRYGNDNGFIDEFGRNNRYVKWMFTPKARVV